MKYGIRSAAASAAATLLLTQSAFGAGFQVNEHSAVNTGRASSVTATVRDASAVFHNPAGLTNIEGTEFQVGVSLIRPRGQYEGLGYASTSPTPGQPVTADAVSSFIPVPNIYAARALSQKAFVGFGFYAPYGLGIKWENPETFVGRTAIEELSLRSFFFTPAIALKLSDNVSVAVSVSLVPATVYLRRTLGTSDGQGQILFPTPQYSREGKLEVAGTAFGVGANAGVQVKLIDHLRLGLSYRSAVDLAFSGKANFDLPPEVSPEVAARFPDGEGSADITLPHSFALGLGWEQGALTVEASTQLTLWTSYKELRLNFDTGLPQRSSASPRDWVAVPMFRLGGQYKINDALTGRLGLAYDISPVPNRTVDPTLPDNDRLIFSGGAGYAFGNFSVDLAYMGLLVMDREVTAADQNPNFPPGTYNGGFVHLISASLGFKI